MPRSKKPTRLDARAMRYMVESMAMNKPLEDQGENWILGHMVAFADREVSYYRALLVGIIDAAVVGIDRSASNNLKPRDRAAFKGGALWSLVELRKDLTTAPATLLKYVMSWPKKRRHRAAR
jgi:hypothetical protein